MRLFGSLLTRKKKADSVVLIDIGADSIAGAYSCVEEAELPTLLYSRRLSIETRAGESRGRAMLRTLQILGETLIREGAPMLGRATGSGTAHSLIVSVDAPWQKTSVRTEFLEQKTPFTFSKSLVAAALRRSRTAPPDQVVVDESIIGTILNGYETRDPYGKQAHRASIVVLMSLIDEQVARGIQTTLRGLYHTKEISSISGSSLRYQAIHVAFPHEHDALILDATGLVTSIVLVRNGLFVDIIDVADAIAGSDAWVKGITLELAELARRFPLPRTIFLLAREHEVAPLVEALDAANLGALWLSDNPPKIVSVLASHFVSLVRQTADPSPDILSVLMTLYWHRRRLGIDA